MNTYSQITTKFIWKLACELINYLVNFLSWWLTSRSLPGVGRVRAFGREDGRKRKKDHN